MRSPISSAKLIRVALGLGFGLLVLLLLWLLLSLTDRLLSVWQGLQSLPSWVLYLYLFAILGIVAAGVYALWRLLRPRRKAEANALATLDREALEKRMAEDSAAGIDIGAVCRELALLQERKAAGKVYVSFFGEISSGKSSLISALLPGAALETSVVGGTTRIIAT